MQSMQSHCGECNATFGADSVPTLDDAAFVTVVAWETPNYSSVAASATQQLHDLCAANAFAQSIQSQYGESNATCEPFLRSLAIPRPVVFVGCKTTRYNRFKCYPTPTRLLCYVQLINSH